MYTTIHGYNNELPDLAKNKVGIECIVTITYISQVKKEFLKYLTIFL